MRKTIAWYLALTALLAMTLGGCARWRPQTPEERADRVVMHLVNKLELDGAQQQQLERIKLEVLAKSAELRSQRAEDFDVVLAMLRSETIDEARLRMMTASQQAEAHQLIAFVAMKFKEFHALLSPEQRARAAAAMEDFRERRGHRDGWR